jgi:hypothetical protein
VTTPTAVAADRAALPAAPRIDRAARRLIGCGSLAALVGASVTVVAGPVLGAVGLLAAAMFGASAYRPVYATYIYLVTLPFLAGIDRGLAIPLIRPNEAVLVVVVGGAVIGAYFRYLRGARTVVSRSCEFEDLEGSSHDAAGLATGFGDVASAGEMVGADGQVA